MANFTEEAIKRSFRELLRAYPLSEISVKKIAAACGINRNTFYYHFRDITTLIEEVMNDDTDTLIANNPKIDSLEDCMQMTLDFVAENRVAIMNIYNSVSYFARESDCDQGVLYVRAVRFGNELGEWWHGRGASTRENSAVLRTIGWAYTGKCLKIGHLHRKRLFIFGINSSRIQG